ncbi:MAG TPA: MraY family glycosyltransferase [Blastocatellia bacterium]|nr:MraY family glycosyltransferase [Blastocatellia bacterium]
MITTYLICFLSSLLLSFVLTWVARRVAVSRGWAAGPASPRHIHSRPIPRLGGVSIYLSFITVVGLVVTTSFLFDFHIGFSRRTLIWILLPGTLIFLLGLYDDFRPVKPWLKFGVQAAAAVMLFAGGIGISRLSFPLSAMDTEWLALPLTIFWVLLITNAFNLIDGLDGLAAGSALFSTVTVFVVSLVGGGLLVSLITVALAGAILGFLRYNFNPATIFLGDSGSLFVGFMLSALALAGAQKAPTIIAVAIPIVSFGLPLLETALSIVRRFLRGEPLFSADREHIHHKLLERGFSQRQAVVILYGVSAAFAMLSLFLLTPGGGVTGIVLFVLSAMIWLGVQRLGYHEFFELGRIAHRTIEQKSVIKNDLTIRRAVERLSSALTMQQVLAALGEAFEKNDFDSYRLLLTLKGNGCAGRNVARLIDSGGIDLDHCWDKTGVAGVAQWTLKLELIAEDKKQLGFFLLNRAYSTNPLLVDVNLLTSEFQAALTHAVDRATRMSADRSLAVEGAGGIAVGAASARLLTS